MLALRYLITLFLVFSVATKVAAYDEVKMRSNGSNMTLSQRIEMYRNVSTAPSYVKIKISDAKHNKILNMVVENTALAGFIASERGISKSDLEKFYKNDYVKLMLKSDSKLLDLDIEKFEDYLAKIKFGSKIAARKYLQEASFDAPMTFRELEVMGEDELIRKYFFFEQNTKIGSPKPGFSGSHDPRFIALLIDLGYVVSKGDIAPILRIYKP